MYGRQFDTPLKRVKQDQTNNFENYLFCPNTFNQPRIESKLLVCSKSFDPKMSLPGLLLDGERNDASEEQSNDEQLVSHFSIE